MGRMRDTRDTLPTGVHELKEIAHFPTYHEANRCDLALATAKQMSKNHQNRSTSFIAPLVLRQVVQQAIVLSRSHMGVSTAVCVLLQSDFRDRHFSNTWSIVGEAMTASGGGRNGTEAGLDECIIYSRQVVHWLA